MARMVYAKQNDTLDGIVYRYFGKENAWLSRTRIGAKPNISQLAIHHHWCRRYLA